jgi:hypothetical protein
VRILVAALCLLAFTNTWAAIGTVSDHKGDGCEITRGKDKLSGNKGAGIESMDIYTTRSCVTNITFRDDTRIRINENSRLLIDDFVFDPKQSDAGKLALKVGAGTVRYASGQIAKNNPQQVNIKTPTATIAVRGTDFNVVVDETGQSLVILLPSCKDDKEVKRFELEENKCKVGKIEVTTIAGSVTLEEAFAGTYVFSANAAPTPPRIINTVEGNIGNHLLLVQPKEVKQAIREATGKEKEDRQREQQELDSARDQHANKNLTGLQNSYMLNFGAGKKDENCNSITNICVTWERTDTPDIQNRGKGIAYRGSDLDHYAEVKTQGHSSNTAVTIVHNDALATAIIGDGSPGGNVVYIKQNLGVLKKQ